MIKVKVGADKNWLRLRWKENGRYKILYPGCSDSTEGWRTAQRFALQMEEDWEKGNFDFSLDKYRVKSLETLNNRTLGDIYQEWMAQTKKHLSKRTNKGYRSRYNTILPSGILSITPEKITINEVYSLIQFLQQNSNSPAVIRIKIRTLSAVWDWGRKVKKIGVADNPFKEIKLESSETQIDPFSREEVRKILEVSPPDKKLFIKFLFLTGSRIGEAIGLQWGDLSPNCQTVTISRQFTDGEFKPLKKGGKPRTFLLPPNFAEELSAIPRDSDFVFGNPCSTAYFREHWIKTLKDAGVRYRKPYNCRHTFVCHRLQDGWKPTQIVQVTGHSLKVMFESYAAFIAEELHLPDIE